MKSQASLVDIVSAERERENIIVKYSFNKSPLVANELAHTLSRTSLPASQ